MNLLLIWRFVLGYACFRAEGAYSERFVTALYREGLSVWDLRRRDYALYGSIRARQYRRLRVLARECNMRVRVEKKRGLLFWALPVLRQRGLVLSIACFFGAMVFLYQFVWVVEVDGNVDVSEVKILMAAESVGIRPGVRRGAFQARVAEQQIALAVPELAWVGVTTDGSRVIITVKERTPQPEIVDHTEPRNLVAARAGQILLIECYDGTEIAREGSAVAEGDLLISGVVEDKVGNVQLKYARGRVIAETQRSFSAESPLTVAGRELLEENTQRALQFGPFVIPLYWGAFSHDPTEELSREKAQLYLLDMPLPITLYTDTQRRYTETEITLDPHELRGQMLRELRRDIEPQLGGAVVVAEEIAFVKVDGGYRLTLYLALHEDIARGKPVFS